MTLAEDPPLLPPAAATDPAPDRTSLAVWVLIGAGVVVSIMQTLVVPIIGLLPTILDTSTENASWVITATLLFSAVLTPVVGRLGDLFGKRRMLLACNLLLIVGSLICAISSSLLPMLVGRALQGASLPMIPLGISLIRDVVDPRKLGASVALMSASMGIGGALGLPMAAVIAEYLGWQALFWTATVLAALFALLIWRVVPETSLRSGGSVDHVGVALLATGLVGYLLGVSKGGAWGWTSAPVVSCFVVAAVALALWVWWELRVGSPVVDLRTASHRPVWATNLAAVPICLSMFSMSLVGPQILQAPAATGYGMERSILASGLWLAPGGLLMVWVSRVAARIIATRGPRASLVAGAAVIGLSNVAALGLLRSGPVGVLVFGVGVSAGVALTYAAMPSLIMASVPDTQTAAANGFNALSRAIGTSTASALIGLLLGQMTTVVAGRTYPSEGGIRTVLVVGAVASAVAVAAAQLIPRETGLARHEGEPAD